MKSERWEYRSSPWSDRFVGRVCTRAQSPSRLRVACLQVYPRSFGWFAADRVCSPPADYLEQRPRRAYAHSLAAGLVRASLSCGGLMAVAKRPADPTECSTQPE